MRQTLCPYLNKPLTLIDEIDAEHIIPAGIGAPEKFTVAAAQSENRRINRDIDEPFINLTLVRFVAAMVGAESRSGPVFATVEGAIETTGERIRARFTKDGMKPTFVAPVTTDADGNVTAIRGFQDELEKHVAHMAERYRRKGMRIETKERNCIETPLLQFGLEGDLHIIFRALTKAAYLMTVRAMGDEAISSKSGGAFRAALTAATMDEMRKTPLQFYPFAEFPPDIRDADEGEFTLTCLLLPTVGLLTAVSLFGLFKGVFVTPEEGFTSGYGSGETVVIDVATRRLESVRHLCPYPLPQTGN